MLELAMATTYSGMKEFAQAKVHALQALSQVEKLRGVDNAKLSKRQAQIFEFMGEVSLLQQNRDEARTYFEKALACFGTDVAAYNLDLKYIYSQLILIAQDQHNYAQESVLKSRLQALPTEVKK
jgi:tetratricopeptide (TPR) repeat protein